MPIRPADIYLSDFLRRGDAADQFQNVCRARFEASAELLGFDCEAGAEGELIVFFKHALVPVFVWW